MAPIPPIFSLTVPAYKSATHDAPEGTFVLTQPAHRIYLLTFTSPPDNRLTPVFLDVFCQALDIILTLPPGVLMTTSGIPKFYSNGLDYGSAIADPSFMTTKLYPLFCRLLTFPWPTVGLINGHNFAAGLMCTACQDYRIMNPNKGFLCLNELEFNAPLTPAMATIFRVKLPMSTFRTLVLESKRFNAASALEAGIIDATGGIDEAIKFVNELGLVGKAREVGKGSYGLIKEEMYREIISDLSMSADEERELEDKKKRARGVREVNRRRNVELWKAKGGALNEIGGMKGKL